MGATSKITNIVAKLQCNRLDLAKIGQLDCVNYNPSKFAGVHMKLSGGTCNIFASGKIVFLGFKDVDALDEAVLELAGCIGTDFVAASYDPIICNIVGSFSLGQSLHLDESARKFKLSGKFSLVAYEPLYHNALHISLKDSSAAAIIHGSGRGIVTGVTTIAGLDSMLSVMASSLA